MIPINQYRNYIRVCEELPSSCDYCYSTMSYCDLTDINLSVGLTNSGGSTAYLWIKDKFENLYRDFITINSDGSVDINTNNFPDGMFNYTFGPTLMFLSSDIDGNSLIDMNILSITYSCVDLIIYNPNEPNEPIPTNPPARQPYRPSATYVYGATGATGPIGPTGPQGYIGPQGATGADSTVIGPTGPQGDIGPQGFQGVTGFDGTNGATGSQGPQGFQGITGSNGTNGVNGATGSQGQQGFQGVNGSNGTNGVNGATGSQGPQGFQGVTGSNGTNGATGSQGPQGFQGVNGANGSTGSQGPQGSNGSNGATGSQGPQGPSWNGGTVSGETNFTNTLISNTFSATTGIIGNPGSESSIITVNGITFNSSFKISDIDGSNIAQTIFHKHSTTAEPMIIGARSNSDTATHSNVTAGQNVFTIYGSGWLGSSYKLNGQISIETDIIGSLSNTSSPGKIDFYTTPNASIWPEIAVSIDSQKQMTAYGSVLGKNISITGTAGVGYLTLVGQSSNPPSPTAGTLLLHSKTVNGITRLEQDNESTTNLVYGRDNVIVCKNDTGSTILKGQAVYTSGVVSNSPQISLAQANSANPLPAVGVALDNILTNTFGQVMTSGIISFNTTAFSSVDKVYVSPTVAGGLTSTRPSGTTNYVQRIGTILVSGIDGVGQMLVAVSPSLLNMETGTNAATWTGRAVTGTTFSATSLNMNTNKITNVAAGTTGTDAINFSQIVGYTLPMVLATATVNPADGTSYAIAMPTFNSLSTAGSTRVRMMIPKTGTLKTVYLTVGQTVTGTNETSTVYWTNNTTSTSTSIITGIDNSVSTQYKSATGLSIPVTAADLVEIKWICPTWATNPTGVYMTAVVYIE